MRPDSKTSKELAADWIVRRDAGLTPSEDREFSEWLAEGSAHRDAWEQAQAAWRGLTRPSAVYKETVLQELARWETEKRRRRRRRVLPFAAGIVLAAAAAWVIVFRAADHALPAGTAPVFVQKPQQQTLADGSLVQLNAAAEIQVDYTADARRVRLLRGEAHFDVAKDEGRPFVVSAGSLSVEAVGTAFSVRLAPDNMDVLVTKGKVQVSAPLPNEAPAAVLPLSAGQLAVIPLSGEPALPAAAQSVTSEQIDAALAWRTFRVEFSGTPLADVIALFNDKSRIKLRLADPALGVLRVSGTYWINNPEGFARLLENGFNLRAERTGEAEISLRSTAQ